MWYPLRFMKYGSRVFYKRDMMPLYMIHFITENCNANCFHCLCGYHAHWERNELSIDEIERFSKGLGDMLFVFLTGGRQVCLRNGSKRNRVITQEAAG